MFYKYLLVSGLLVVSINCEQAQVQQIPASQNSWAYNYTFNYQFAHQWNATWLYNGTTQSDNTSPGHILKPIIETAHSTSKGQSNTVLNFNTSNTGVKIPPIPIPNLNNVVKIPQTSVDNVPNVNPTGNTDNSLPPVEVTSKIPIDSVNQINGIATPPANVATKKDKNPTSDDKFQLGTTIKSLNVQKKDEPNFVALNEPKFTVLSEVPPEANYFNNQDKDKNQSPGNNKPPVSGYYPQYPPYWNNAGTLNKNTL